MDNNELTVNIVDHNDGYSQLYRTNKSINASVCALFISMIVIGSLGYGIGYLSNTCGDGSSFN